MISDNAVAALIGLIYKVLSLISNGEKVLTSVIMLISTSVYDSILISIVPSSNVTSFVHHAQKCFL